MSSLVGIQAFHETFISWDRWTRRRKLPNRGSKNYRACFGSGCEVSRLTKWPRFHHLRYIISQWRRSPPCHCTVPCTSVDSQCTKFIMSSLFIRKTAPLDTPYDWNYTAVPQKGMHGRSFSYPCGRLLGGSSSAIEFGGIQRLSAFIEYISADYMIHQYGSDEDWDRYAKLTGDPGWAWNNVKNYVKKVLHFNAFRYIKLNTDLISSMRKSYLQTTDMVQLANLFCLYMVSAGRSSSAFQGWTRQLTHV